MRNLFLQSIEEKCKHNFLKPIRMEENDAVNLNLRSKNHDSLFVCFFV